MRRTQPEREGALQSITLDQWIRGRIAAEGAANLAKRLGIGRTTLWRWSKGAQPGRSGRRKLYRHIRRMANNVD